MSRLMRRVSGLGFFDVERRVLDFGQHVAGHEVALLSVGVAREDEALYSEPPVLEELRPDLVRVAHQRRTTAASGPSNPGEEMRFRVALRIRIPPQLRLAANPLALVVQ